MTGFFVLMAISKLALAADTAAPVINFSQSAPCRLYLRPDGKSSSGTTIKASNLPPFLIRRTFQPAAGSGVSLPRCARGLYAFPRNVIVTSATPRVHG